MAIPRNDEIKVMLEVVALLDGTGRCDMVFVDGRTARVARAFPVDSAECCVLVSQLR